LWKVCAIPEFHNLTVRRLRARGIAEFIVPSGWKSSGMVIKWVTAGKQSGAVTLFSRSAHCLRVRAILESDVASIAFRRVRDIGRESNRRQSTSLPLSTDALNATRKEFVCSPGMKDGRSEKDQKASQKRSKLKISTQVM
jgi:hypothetical protein